MQKWGVTLEPAVQLSKIKIQIWYVIFIIFPFFFYFFKHKIS